ncbi:MAG TPA: hypothetical protein VK087_04990 [Tissierellaceae bacterium]|nr:hypothetical protein [Tissierellaceae bacterium]
MSPVDLYIETDNTAKLLELYDKYKDEIYNENIIIEIAKVYNNYGQFDSAIKKLDNFILIN